MGTTMNVAGTIGLAVFYGAVLFVGLLAAAFKRRKAARHSGHSQMILVNRSVGLVLGIASLTATWVGDTFVNGTADWVFRKGLAWCQVPIGYSLSLFFGAILFANPMRKAEYVTMLDPFQQHYGARLGGGLMFLPAFCGDLFWCAALLRALGAALSIVVGIDINFGVAATATLIALYTVSGGMYSVLWTGGLQFVCIAMGLGLFPAYANSHRAVSLEKSLAVRDWLGDFSSADLGEWLDAMLLAIFGGIPWQSYFQRILIIWRPSFASTLSIFSMFTCLVLAVPSAMIGIVARSTDWSLIESYNKTVWRDNGGVVTSLVLRHLTPQWVSFLILGAISAGIMASADSSIFGISSMFSRNIYKLTIRPKATERELDWVLRISIVIVAFLSAAIALSVSSVFYLAYFCCDLVYVVLFPQLLSVVQWPSAVDSYGCLAGYVIAVAIRISGGEKSLGIPTFVEYPYYDSRTHTQKFPFRSLAMLAGIFAQLIVSLITRNLIGRGYLPRCCDPLNVYAPGNTKNTNGVVQSNSGAALIDCSMNDASPGHMSDAPTTLSSSRTDYDASSTDTQLQQPISQQQAQQQQQQQQQHQRYDAISVLYEPKQTAGNAAHKANQSLQGLHALRETMSPKQQTATVTRLGQTLLHHPSSMMSNQVASGQILGVKNLNLTPGHGSDCYGPQPPRIMSPTAPTTMGTLYAKVPTTIITNGRLEGEKMGGDRSNMELNLNLTDGSGIVKKNIKGVKLIGMEGGTLRRPSLQGTFSPTPSVEMVNIFDRRQSSGSYGPSSLSPIPGVEACKTHGTAVSGQAGNEHCRIKRSIVRHHSFNDTGDRTLTNLARQPAYPSMPLTTLRKDGQGKRTCSQIHRYSSSLIDDTGRPEEQTCISRAATLRRERCKSHRYSSYVEDKQTGLMGHLLISPTYSMYNSAVKNCNYFVSDDEAVSRF